MRASGLVNEGVGEDVAARTADGGIGEDGANEVVSGSRVGLLSKNSGGSLIDESTRNSTMR